MRSSKIGFVSVLAVLMAFPAGCTTPIRVKTASQVQIDGYREIKGQVRRLNEQIESVLRTYSRLNLEAAQRTAILLEINRLSQEATSLDEADQEIVKAWRGVEEQLQQSFTDLENNLSFLRRNRNAALKEIDNLIAIHSIINDYLGIDLSVSTEDVQKIINEVKELRNSQDGQ